ncbi:hypothetical protein BABINDRAFT_159038 [Babjeviella inositovora NRRL Y-12698]|uniref:Cation efflux protein transmembrane domain-containing protein n=1 Tax=Babjeviella inositovora NRRL Y-12698 TaxID=984486 RepID=A0A1E3QZD2_9ASCO|nr:uncharacterized protein BABINDRAFT_159038 [Babjeviella inositovora NRRL Y-12698]ODQ82447.1 hypothetical protein BABINDRAFT_159038 [Babjeviella inositovora NRRL Y-12698]
MSNRSIPDTTERSGRSRPNTVPSAEDPLSANPESRYRPVTARTTILRASSRVRSASVTRSASVERPELHRIGSVAGGGRTRSSLGGDAPAGFAFLGSNYERIENLQDMRPRDLVGEYKRVSWNDFAVSQRELKACKNKLVREFYDDQNELIERYEEIDALLDSGITLTMLHNYGSDIDTPTMVREASSSVVDDVGDRQTSGLYQYDTILSRAGAPGNIDIEGGTLLGYNKENDDSVVAYAIMVNFVVNFALLLGKVAVAVMTSSISIIASLVDSLLDFLSTLIIFVSNKLSTKRDWKTKHLYPVGRSRLEPLGVLVFSIIIIISFLQVGNLALGRLLHDKDHVAVEVGLFSSVIMGLTIVVKLGCWVWCRSVKSSSVQALAQDAMTDIVFNTVSILMPTIGHFFGIWWMDAAGALVLCMYVIVSWAQTAFGHIDNLTGAAADKADQQVILYLCLRFATSIKQITAINIYHVGDGLNVEVDLVLDPNSNLKDAHDIGEALQYAIETLPMVERAFVHLDYRTGNYVGHLA